MKTTSDFLDDLRARHGLASDNKLALHMGWDRQQLRRYRNGKHTFDDATAIKVAAQLGIEPDHIMACMAAQRAKSPESRTAWERIAAKVAACILAGIALSVSSPAPAAFNINTSTGQFALFGSNLHICVKKARRRIRRALVELMVFLCRLICPLALLSALCGPAHAGEWTGDDTTRELVFAGITAIDWAQTLSTVIKHPERYPSETNRLLGEHPSRADVNVWFGLGIVMHALIAEALPSKYRAPFQYVSIGLEAGQVIRNYRIGVRIEF